MAFGSWLFLKLQRYENAMGWQEKIRCAMLIANGLKINFNSYRIFYYLTTISCE